MEPIQIVAFGMLVSTCCLLLWSVFASKKWIHDEVGHGYVEKVVGGDSFQPTYSCRFCDKLLAIDSQGGVFHLSAKK